jgi:hypothetical protein
VRRYWEKKRIRKTQKFVRYECRKNLAEKRFRYQGRFVKFEQLAQLDPDMVYNPHQRPEPKTKPIFKVIKTSGSSRKSSCSGGSGDCLADIERQADQMNLFTSSIPTGTGDLRLNNLFEHQKNVQIDTTTFGIPGFSMPTGYKFPGANG